MLHLFREEGVFVCGSSGIWKNVDPLLAEEENLLLGVLRSDIEVKPKRHRNDIDLKSNEIE